MGSNLTSTLKSFLLNLIQIRVTDFPLEPRRSRLMGKETFIMSSDDGGGLMEFVVHFS